MTEDLRLPDWIKPGASFSLHDRRYHIRGIVDDQVVVREWWKHKPWWHYSVLDRSWLKISEQWITRIKRAPKEAPHEPQSL